MTPQAQARIAAQTRAGSSFGECITQYECHVGNQAIKNILSAARSQGR